MNNPMAFFYANIYNAFFKSYMLGSKKFLSSLQAPTPSPSSCVLDSHCEKPFLKQKEYQTKKKVSSKGLLGYV